MAPLLTEPASGTGVSPTGTPTSTGSNGFTFENSDFFVNVQSPAGTSMLLHKDGDWTQPCKISTSQLGQGVDQYCILEANELDLYFNGAGLVWNGPSEQCTYVGVRPYSYYLYQPGVGPTAVAATSTNGGPPVISSQSGGSAAAFVNGTGGLSCTADYSTLTPTPGPNCCAGSYLYTLTTVTARRSHRHHCNRRVGRKYL